MGNNLFLRALGERLQRMGRTGNAGGGGGRGSSERGPRFFMLKEILEKAWDFMLEV